jgi:hypothetical protein
VTGFPQSVAVVDPMADHADILDRVEGRATWSEPRTSDGLERLEAAAARPRVIGTLIRTKCWAVDGVELAPLAVIPGGPSGVPRSVRRDAAWGAPRSIAAFAWATATNVSMAYATPATKGSMQPKRCRDPKTEIVL